MKVAVMTDSTAYIPREEREALDIHMIPLSVVFKDRAYLEEVEITPKEFYAKVKEADELPTTSQPSIGVVTDKMEELARDYDAVVSIHLSSGISGTYQTVASTVDMVDGLDVYAYDSEMSCMAQGFYAIEAAKMAKAGQSPQAIISRLDEMKESMRAYFMVDDLHNLQRGGRLSGTQAFVGTLLQVKPVLHFENKKIVPFEKIRTRKKALKRILSMLEEQAEKQKSMRVVFIATERDDARKLETAFKDKYPDIETSVSYFGPVIGTHLGEGSIGAAWYEE